jgi:hypothetical protein
LQAENQTTKKNPSPDKKVCESCGREFSCEAPTGNCWCFEIEMHPETLVQIQKDFVDCLCRDCLIKRQLLRKPAFSKGKTSNQK